MTISNYGELEILDHLTGRLAWTAPTAVYVKLHLADPTDTGTISPAVNTTRVVATWGVAAAGSITTNATITWNNVSTTETYSHWSLWDNLTVGNCLWTGALATPISVTAGDTFEITSLTLTLE